MSARSVTRALALCILVLAPSACAATHGTEDAGPATDDAGSACVGPVGAGACTDCAWCRCYRVCDDGGSVCVPDTVPCLSDAGAGPDA